MALHKQVAVSTFMFTYLGLNCESSRNDHGGIDLTTDDESLFQVRAFVSKSTVHHINSSLYLQTPSDLEVYQFADVMTFRMI